MTYSAIDKALEIGIPGFFRKPICIYANNNGAIALASHPEFHVNTNTLPSPGQISSLT